MDGCPISGTHCELNVLAGLPVLEVGRGGDDVVVGLQRRRAQEYHMGQEFGRVVEDLQGLEKGRTYYSSTSWYF